MAAWIEHDAHGLPLVRVENKFAAARISLQGANVMEYTPQGEKPILWVSGKSCFALGKPIRGGVPICWPWFGAHPSEPGLPAHGFARLCLWNLDRAKDLADESTEVVLTLTGHDVPAGFKPSSFRLRFTVTVGLQLGMALEMANAGISSLEVTGALHTYFSVGDIGKAWVEGLDNVRCFDALARQEVVQQGAIRFNAEFDRVFQDTEGDCVICDPVFNRRIRIAKKGSRSTVVWNPWSEKSRRMPDFGDEEYRAMLCVETANARDDRRTLPPGGSHTLAAIVSKEEL